MTRRTGAPALATAMYVFCNGQAAEGSASEGE